MLLAVVNELDRGVGLLFAIDDHADRLSDFRPIRFTVMW